MTDKQGIPFIVKIKNKDMTHIKKAVPVGLMIDERIQNASRPHLSGKVSTDRLTEGASVSRYEKQFLAKRH